MEKASKVVAILRQYKNYQEKRNLGTREQMWNFHWCPGKANYTIWSILYQEYTKRNFQGQPWCAIFGSDAFVLAYGLEKAKQLLGGELPYNCQQFVNAHRSDLRLNHIPGIGCPVIYWTGNKYGHWGTCTGVDDNGRGFIAVEGNTSGGMDKIDPDGGAVVEKWHSLADTTLFWHPDFVLEDPIETETYSVSCGRSGLTITADTLNIRKFPTNGPIVGYYKNGDQIFPTKKQFSNGRAWYNTESGWISASYLDGWVLENNGCWWYLMAGYNYSVNKWQEIDEKWYYFDSTGYLVTSAWIQSAGKDYYLTSSGAMAQNVYVKSIDKELYYWLNESGEWIPQMNTMTPDLDKHNVIK